MKVTTLNYRKNIGWNTPLPPIDSPQTLVLVFGASSFLTVKQPFLDLKNKYPNSIIAGCSTAGEIFNDLLLDHSLVVSITQFEKTKIRFFTQAIAKTEDSTRAGKDIATHLVASDLSAILILTDGLLVNGAMFAKGINSVIKEHTVVTGGLAGDGREFKTTWILVDGLPCSAYACGIGFYGDSVRVNYGSNGGWKAFGPDHLITKSHKNVLYELDNKPALELYKNYLGAMADGLPTVGLRYPLSLTNTSTGEKLVRTIFAIDKKTQSLVFAGDIPEGQYARLMYATFDNLLDGAAYAASMLNIETKPNQEVLAIAISCVGRRMLMEEEPGAELETTLESMPKQTKQTKQVGFYSYGELSPYSKNTGCDLHNQTMTLTSIYEQ